MWIGKKAVKHHIWDVLVWQWVMEGAVVKVNFAGYRMSLPGHPVLRIALGILLLLGGILGFLPVLGYWMIPLGLAVLAVDIPAVRRFHRKMTVKFGNWLHRRWPNAARRLGYGAPRRERKT